MLTILVKIGVFIRPGSSILQTNSHFGLVGIILAVIFDSIVKNLNYWKKCRNFSHFTEYEKLNHKCTLWPLKTNFFYLFV